MRIGRDEKLHLQQLTEGFTGKQVTELLDKKYGRRASQDHERIVI